MWENALPGGKSKLGLPSFAGTGDQVLSSLGGVDAWIRRLGISLVGTFAFYNLSVLLTAIASLFWVWSPILVAASANAGLRFRFKYAGVQICLSWNAPTELLVEGPSWQGGLLSSCFQHKVLIFCGPALFLSLQACGRHVSLRLRKCPY